MAWLSGYSYRKKVTIAGSSGAGTGYQILLKIGESAGSSGADFHLEGHALNFPNDIRFTASDEITQYSYWIESIEGASPNRLVYVWVKVDESLDADADIYVYYGKSGDTSASNGSTTFEFFDDFDDNNLDWTVVSGVWNESGTTVVGSYEAGAPIVARIKKSFTDTGNYRYSWRAKYTTVIVNGFPWSGLEIKSPATDYDNGDQGYITAVYTETGSTKNKVAFFKATSGSSTSLAYWDQPISDDVFHIWRMVYHNQNISVYKQNNLVGSVSDSTYTSGDVIRLRFASKYGIVEFDWVFVSKYISPEPSFSTAYTEEEVPVISVSFGIGSAIYSSYHSEKHSVPSLKIISALQNGVSSLIQVETFEQKYLSTQAKLQSALNYLINSGIQIQSLKQFLSNIASESISLNSYKVAEETQINKQIAKSAETIEQISDLISSSVSAFQNVATAVQKLSSLLVDLQTLLQKHSTTEVSTQDNIIKEVSSYIKLISGALISYHIPFLVEIKSEISGYLNTIYETTGTHSKQITPVIETGNDILQSITSALETTKSFEAKLNKILEILRQVTQETSVEVDNERSIEFNLNILTEIVESASELIQVLQTIGEKASHYYTTLETFLYYRTDLETFLYYRTERGDNNG